ncbi:hypothetical protein [Microbulbifer mangrovi]|uniref:hypothetical protein n=1 Tax=Microbulbifer mangrovi TaxID=927787 RepID=UPI000990601F|nr:hypothetical protein [Microbulbifer mangrovi]
MSLSSGNLSLDELLMIDQIVVDDGSSPFWNFDRSCGGDHLGFYYKGQLIGAACIIYKGTVAEVDKLYLLKKWRTKIPIRKICQLVITEAQSKGVAKLTYCVLEPGLERLWERAIQPFSAFALGEGNWEVPL